MRNKAVFFAVIGLATGAPLFGEVLDRPSGIKIGQRMTLRPYVSFSATFDSNAGATGNGTSDSDVMWTVSPTLGLTYNADNWSLLLNGYYNYHAYSENSHGRYNQHSYGEKLRFNWSDSKGGDKGWSLVIDQTFRQVTMADDFSAGDGNSYYADSRQLQFSGALQRRINENWHGDVNASYYWIDYMNHGANRYTNYGWDRWSVGAEAGFAPSKWTDLIVSGSYMGYSQDNTEGSNYDNSSSGYSLQAGLGSYMTERITYRMLAGWSRFEYADGDSSADGFVYTLSGLWRISDSLSTMLLATSYYQPSERQYASQSRVDALSWGLTKTMVQGKLRATFDVRYRRETHEYISSYYNGSGSEYVLDIVTGRFGLDYIINRFFTVFACAEYQRSWNDNSSRRGGAYDYDRWRITGGFRLTY